MTHRYVPNPGPHISTPLTNRLLDQLDHCARRSPDVIDAVQRVRDGDDATLQELIRRVQAGDQDAAIITLGALVPVLSKLVLRRYPKLRWDATIDDYLTVAHITICEATFTGRPSHVLGRVLSRTRRRFDRQLENRAAGVIPTAQLDATADPLDLEQTAIARITLDDLTTAVRTGKLATSDWELVRAVAAEDGPTRKMTGAERQRLLRARRALGQFRDWRVAA